MTDNRMVLPQDLVKRSLNIPTNAAVEDSDKDVYFQIYMLLIMMVLALLILNYADKFPEAKAICDAAPDDMVLVDRLAAEIKKT